MVSILWIAGTSDASANRRDSLALVAFYQAMDGPNWTQGWDFNEVIEDWHGVSTDLSGNVIRLDLAGNNLSGQIPEEIGFLSELQVLQLPFNNIIGQLPSSIGILSKLRELSLFNNNLNQPLPDTLVNLKNLEQLSLSNNSITGTLPKRIGQMSSLKMLLLDRNELTGGLPVSIGQCSELEFIALNDNHMDGNIPAEMGNLDNLREFLVFNNQLEGSLPASLSQIDSLTFFWVQNNRFEGAIPPFEQSNLKSIRAERNSFSELPDLTTLKLGTGFPEGLSVENNQLSFEDLIHNIELNDSIRFSYRPQDTLGAAEIVYISQGERLQYQLPFDDTVSTSAYRWFKDNDLNQLTNQNALIINNIQKDDEGLYYAEVRNTLVQDLVLVTREIQVVVRDSISCDVPPASEFCFQAPIFCESSEIDFYCGTLPFAFDTMPCVSRDITQEIRWVAWRADSSHTTIEVLPFSCSDLAAGIQWTVYQGCLGRQIVYCQDECTNDNTSIELDSLIPGETYFLALRSCGGQCKYQLRVSGGSESTTTPVASDIIVPDTVCTIGEEIQITLENSPLGVERYIWSVDNDTSETTLPFNSFVPATSGLYEVCVYGITACDTTNTLCKSIHVFPGVQIANLNIDVVRNDSFYILEFVINGGLGTVTIDSLEGTYNAVTQTFVSDLIPCGSAYTVIVTDESGCEDRLEGIELCKCVSEAGRMPTEIKSACTEGLLRVGPASRVTIDTNDASVFVLQESQTFGRQASLVVSTSPLFAFDDQVLSTDRVYYAYHVVGNAIGQQVDFSDPCLSHAGPQPVIFYSYPNADAGVDIRVCQNEFTLRAGILPSGATGAWDQLTGASGVVIADSSERVTQVTVQQEGVYTFTWKAERNDCEAVDTVQVEVLPIITGEILGPDSLCRGQVDTLRLSRAFDSYLWQNGDTLPYLVINEPGQYCVDVALNGLCTKRICIRVQDAVLNTPEILGDLFLCEGDTTQLQVIPQYQSYEWNNGDERFFIKVDSAGTYCITVTDFGGCQATDCVVVVKDESRRSSISDTLCYGEEIIVLDSVLSESGTYSIRKDDGQACDTVVEVELLVYDEIYISDSLIVKDDGTGNGSISVNIRGGNPPYKYLWNTGATIPFISGLMGNIYTLLVTDQNDCQQIFTFDIRESSSVSNLQEAGMDLFPNPIGRGQAIQLNWRSNLEVNEEWEFRLSSLDGKDIHRINPQLRQGSNSGFLPIPEMSEGVYLLYVSDDHGRPLGVSRIVIRP